MKERLVKTIEELNNDIERYKRQASDYAIRNDWVEADHYADLLPTPLGVGVRQNGLMLLLCGREIVGRLCVRLNDDSI